MLGISKSKWLDTGLFDWLDDAPKPVAQPRPTGRSMMEIVQENCGPYPSADAPTHHRAVSRTRRSFPTHPSRPK